MTAQPIYITVPADFGRTRVVQLDKDDVPIRRACSERVRQAMLARDDKSVFIRADGQRHHPGPHGRVMDKLKEGGVEKVGDHDEARRSDKACTEVVSATVLIDRVAGGQTGLSRDGARVARARTSCVIARVLSLMPASWRSVVVRQDVDADDDHARRRARGRTPAA